MLLNTLLRARPASEIYEQVPGRHGHPRRDSPRPSRSPARTSSSPSTPTCSGSPRTRWRRRSSRPRPLSGTVVVQDVKTGQLLAVASYPTFDPNQPGQDPRATGPTRAFTDVYEPGSTGKVITRPRRSRRAPSPRRPVVEVPNRMHRADTRASTTPRPPDRVPHLRRRAGPVQQHRHHRSPARRSPLDDVRYFRKFGLGPDLGHRASPARPRACSPPERLERLAALHDLFGQGLSVNALQAAGVYQTIANGGVRMPPQPRRRRPATTTATLTPAARRPASAVVSPGTAKQGARACSRAS